MSVRAATGQDKGREKNSSSSGNFIYFESGKLTF